MSFLQGWVTVFAWVAAAVLVPFLVGSQICGLLTLNYPGYTYHGWHTTLIAYGIMALPLAANLIGKQTLEPIEIVGAILHVLFFIGFVATIVTLGGRNDAEYVFTATSGGASGWENSGVSLIRCDV